MTVYPHMFSGLEFFGNAAGSHSDQILILQKSVLRIMLKICPRSHGAPARSLHIFTTLQIMPIDSAWKSYTDFHIRSNTIWPAQRQLLSELSLSLSFQMYNHPTSSINQSINSSINVLMGNCP